jgi:hypothetical protein
MSYSLAILTDSTGEAECDRQFGAYLLFVRWKGSGEQGVAGHLESEFLAWGATSAQARRAAGTMPLGEAGKVLDALVRSSGGGHAGRRRWEVARDGSPDT